MKLTVGIIALLVSNIITAKNIYYVTQNGTGDGSSWAKAAGNIQTMIDKTIAGDEVWVAKGTYYPTTETIARDSRSRTFLVKSGISLYGGFAGTETALSKRLLSDLDNNGKVDSCELVNTTILSGDIDGVPDVWTKTTNTNGSWKWTITGNTGNSYRVITGSASALNGFSVLGGNANISDVGNGGGIYANSVTNCIVTNCSTSGSGGGIHARYSINCLVTNCSAGVWGGGIFSSHTGGFASNCIVTNCSSDKYGGGISATSIANCIVKNCSAGNYGGGIHSYPYSSPSVTNSAIVNCSSGLYGGGIYAYAATSGTNSLTNCIVTNCYAVVYGGGIYASTVSGTNSVTNCMVTNCSVNNYGGGIYASTASGTNSVTNCIVANCSTANYDGGIYASSIKSCAASNNKTGNNIGSGVSASSGFISPEISLAYVRPTSFIGVATTDAQKAELLSADWHLKEGSPCINAGTSTINGEYIIRSDKDFDGNSRVLYGNVDIGAYEYVVPVINMPTREDFNTKTDLSTGNLFYHSSKLNTRNDILWKVANQKASFSWQTNLTSAYSNPIFTYQIDGTKATKVFLRYEMYFQAYSGTISPLGTEKLNIEFSTDLNTWNTIATYSNANGTIANKNYKHDISSLAAGKTFFIRFNANGVNSNRIEKWEIDNVIIDTDGLSTGIKLLEEPSYYCNIDQGVLNIWNLKEGAKVQLFDINGRLLKDWDVKTSNSLLYRLSNHGAYIIRSGSGSNVESKKVVW